MRGLPVDIDLVYLYVNSRDETWLSGRRQYAQDGINGVVRFRDNDELLFSLRSVETYAPWIRTVHIVTDSAVPEWLDTENRRLHIVRHEEIMPPEILPCYNSNVIESFISGIPGLSEVFLYANDDTLFGNAVTPDFFFRDGKPVIRMWDTGFDPDRPNGLYEAAIANACRMTESRYGKDYRYMPWHNVDVYTKKWFDACRAEFRDEFARASSCRLRTGTDIQRVIFQYYMLAHDGCALKTYRHTSRFVTGAVYAAAGLFPARLHDFFFCSIHDLVRSPVARFLVSRKPRCMCINDSEDTTDEDIAGYQAYMRRLFPKKSGFEI